MLKSLVRLSGQPVRSPGGKPKSFLLVPEFIKKMEQNSFLRCMAGGWKAVVIQGGSGLREKPSLWQPSSMGTDCPDGPCTPCSCRFSRPSWQCPKQRDLLSRSLVWRLFECPHPEQYNAVSIDPMATWVCCWMHESTGEWRTFKQAEEVVEESHFGYKLHIQKHSAEVVPYWTQYSLKQLFQRSIFFDITALYAHF